jgi:hypothetical protein
MANEIAMNLEEEAPVPNIPLSIPGDTVKSHLSPDNPDAMPTWMTTLNPLGQTITPVERPLVNTLKESKDKPGWWRTAAHNFAEYNLEVEAFSFAKHALTYENPLKEDTPENWSAFTPEALGEFPMEYWPTLVEAKGPKDLEARQEAIRKQILDDDYFSQGPFTAKLLGGIAGGLSSPASMAFLRLATTAKYATVSQNILMNAARTSPGIALDSFARNALIQADRQGGTIEKALRDGLVDTVLGVGLVGVGSGLGATFRNASLWNTNRLLKMSLEGVEAAPVVNEKGELTGALRARPMNGFNLSAAEVDVGQTYLDEQMAKGGLLDWPYIGEGIKKLMSIPGLESPAFRAMRSPYLATKSFFNRLVGSPFITEKEAAGVAVPDSAVQISDAYAAQALDFTLLTRKKFMEANGIEGSEVGVALKNLKQVITKERQIDMDSFGKEVRRVMYDQTYKSQWRQAHEVADAAHELLNQMNEIYSGLTGRPMFKDPRTAWRYLPQNDNVSQMIAREDEWVGITADELLKQDQRIMDLKRPITESKSRIDALKEQINAIKTADKKNPLLRNLRAQLNQANANLRKQHDDLVKTIIDSPDDHILLEDRVLLNNKERDALKAVLEPMKKAESNLKALKKESDKISKKKPKELTPDEVKAKARLEEEVFQVEEELQRIKDELNDRAHLGEIDSKYFEWDGYEAKFHDPEASIKFRATYPTDQARIYQAQQWFNAKMNETPQDIIHSVLGDLTGDRGMPSYFKQRSVMIPSSVYNEAGFLDPDIAKTITAYMQSVGRVFGFKQAFPEFAKGFDHSGFIKALTQEHSQKKEKLLAQKRTPERDKELLRLDKEYKDEQKFISQVNKLYWGRYSSDFNPATAKGIGIMKNIVAGVKLGAVPVYQLTDAAGIVMKQGLVPFLFMGLKPLLLSMNGFVKGKHAEAWIQNAAHTRIGLNGVQNGYAQKFFNNLSMSEPPVGGATHGVLEKVSVGTKNFAQWSGNFFGINAIANVNERIAAGAFQSEVMQAAYAFKAGTITKAQKVKMAKYGIQIEDWADRFISESKAAGGWSEGKFGHQSLYYKWTDHEASARMSMSIRRAVHDSVVNGNIFQSPLWSNHPLGSMVFMFHAWAYNAFNRYTVPLLQRPDAEHILGATLLVGFSMLSEPLLRMANGKEPYTDEDSFMSATMKGLEYSGILGPTWEVLANINKAIGNPIFPSMQTERRKGYNKWGGFAGPVIGSVLDIGELIGHGIKGDITQGDAKKLAHMTPLLSNLALRGKANQFIESSGLPASRKHAEPWMWRKSIYGDNE